MIHGITSLKQNRGFDVGSQIIIEKIVGITSEGHGAKSKFHDIFFKKILEFSSYGAASMEEQQLPKKMDQLIITSDRHLTPWSAPRTQKRKVSTSL